METEKKSNRSDIKPNLSLSKMSNQPRERERRKGAKEQTTIKSIVPKARSWIALSRTNQ